MKGGWATERLGDYVVVQNGYAFSSSDYSPDGHFVMRIANVQDGYISNVDPKYINLPIDGSLDRFVLSEGDILMSLTGNIGRVGLVESDHLPALLNQRVARINVRSRSNLSSSYLLYFLRSDEFRHELSSAGHGVAQQNVSTKELVEIKFPVPPMSEQRRIVAILDEALEGISTASANAEKNLQNARELFEAELGALVSERRDQSWTDCRFADACEIVSKLVDPRKAQYQDLPHVGAGNIESNSGALLDVLTAREEQLISGKFLFDDTMVLYSKIRPYLKKVVRPDFSGLCSADIYPLVPKSGRIARDFLYYLLLTTEFTEYAIKGSARAGMPKVNREHLFAYELSLPKIEEQVLIAERLDLLTDETRRLGGVYERKLAALDELKKSLLHQAFTGAL